MKVQKNTFIDFILKEWLVMASGVGVVLTSLYVDHFPAYSIQELQVLFILFILFIVVNGLERSGVIVRIAKSVGKGRAISLKLILTTFFLSMLVTNDVALIVMVPLTLSLSITRKDILVISEALAANAGSALTPLGNPQNLYIYWFYKIEPAAFVRTIMPFSLVFLVLLVVLALFIRTRNEVQGNDTVQKIDYKAYIYGFLLVAVLFMVLRVLSVLTGIIIIIFAVVVDRKILRIDYALLLTFFFFFGFTENIKEILTSEITHSGHIFLFSALASQIMSNVPTTLLFAKFTSNWKELLWGVNVGGFGSLFGSLANLIAYKIYISHEDTTNSSMFIAKFLLFGYAAFLVSIGLYFFFYHSRGLF